MRVLVAGIGNLFFGDDGFGCAVARALLELPLPAGVVVRDFGIRGLDLAYELTNGYDLAILVDAARRGHEPGELFVLALSAAGDQPLALEGHGMTPEKVLATARSLGGELPVLRLVGCEPAELGSEDEPASGLSPVVALAVPRAVRLVWELLRDPLGEEAQQPGAHHA